MIKILITKEDKFIALTLLKYSISLRCSKL